jgi:hypothetical protein
MYSAGGGEIRRAAGAERNAQRGDVENGLS